MKQTIRFIALLIAVLCSSSAFAVVDPYEAMEITPAEGEVTSLQHFTITFAGLPVVVNPDAVPTLVKGGGATHEGTMRVADDGTTVLVDFDVCCTASGHYFLNLPENSLTVNGQRLLPLTLRFNINGTIDSFYEQITVDPVEGEVESLQNFTVSFPEYVGEIAYGSMATLTNTTTGKAYRAEMYDVNFNVLIYFPDEVTESGEYVLTIPDGAVIIYTMGEEVHELNFHYTLVGKEPSFYDQITVDPEEGIVESLQNFTITLPAAVDEVVAGSMATLTNTMTGSTCQAGLSADGNTILVCFPDEVTEIGRYSLSIPAGSFIVNALGEEVNELVFNYTILGGEMPDFTINPPEGELYILQNFTIAYGQPVVVDEDVHPVLLNDETGEVFSCNMLEIGGNAFIYKEYPLSVVGDYTLVVPAGCIIIDDLAQANPEMVFHYTVVEKDTYVPPVIESQPDGELRLYRRTGGVVLEVEKDYTVEEGENPYEIIFSDQEGTLSFVFADSNKVYIQHPVSWSYYDGWIEGTLSEDGKTITVPMGQYIAYARSLEMAVQVGIFVYDDSQGTYVYDETIDELTYTINDDGTISQNDTDPMIILGTMNRAFGSVFQYLDYEWLQSGDYASVYVPIDETILTPPEGMTTEVYYLTTAIIDGMEWDSFAVRVNVGFDGDDMWLQGISEYLPKAWIKGVRDGNKFTFSNPQLLGSYEMLFYFKAADFNPMNGNLVQKDMVLTMDEEGTFTTFDYVFITVDKDSLHYVNYYQGLTISRYPDMLVLLPDRLDPQDYVFSYKTNTSPDGPLVTRETKVKVAFCDGMVYIMGLWEYKPNEWVAGRIEDDKIVFDLPQFMNYYKEEYSGTYPIYLTTFDPNTGLLLPQVTFDYDAENGTFDHPTSPLSVGINKTGYLSLQDLYECSFAPDNSGLEQVIADDVRVVGYFDLQGHQFTDVPSTGGIYIVKYSDGTARKVMKR